MPLHRLGFLTHSGGERTRPGRRLPEAFGRRSARLAMRCIAATGAPSRKPREAVSMSLYHRSLVLDHPGDAPPNQHNGIESQVPWLTIDDDLPRARTGDDPDHIAAKAAIDRDGK